MKKIVILYSGGLDSLIMYHLALKENVNAEIKLVYYDIGQPYNHKEMKALPDNVEIRKVDWLKKGDKLISKSDSNSGNIIISGRNMTLASLVASADLPDEIWMGALLGETHKGSTDKNYTFLDKINNLFSYVMSPFDKIPVVKFPLADKGWGKFEAVEWGYNNGISKEVLMDSSSCLSGENGKCGKCVVCLRRWGIYRQLGFSEVYNTNPLEVAENISIIKEMLNYDIKGKSHYDEFRRREILPAVYDYYNIVEGDYVSLLELL